MIKRERNIKKSLCGISLLMYKLGLYLYKMNGLDIQYILYCPKLTPDFKQLHTTTHLHMTNRVTEKLCSH